MQLFSQLSKLQGTTSYFDEKVGRVGVKSDTVMNSMKWPVSILPVFSFQHSVDTLKQIEFYFSESKF